MDLRRTLRQYIGESGNPDVLAYGRKLLDDDHEYVRFEWLIRHIIDVGRMRGTRVLDIGCGFGWQAFALALLGNAKVVANDIRSTMTDVVGERVAAMRRAGHAADVTTLCADICAADIPPGSFDAILCNQTVEHVHDLRAMFDACGRVLTSGGRAVILNDNNALNPMQLAEITEMWRKRDTSAEYVAELKAERPIENSDAEPFAVMRRRMIQCANPSLDAQAVERLTTATAGMIEPEIQVTAQRYAPGGPVPTPPKWAWCRNPSTGEYCERQLDPYELAALIEKSGFRTQVRHVYRKFPLSMFNGVQCRPLNHKLFAHRAVFMVLATKI